MPVHHEPLSTLHHMCGFNPPRICMHLNCDFGSFTHLSFDLSRIFRIFTCVNCELVGWLAANIIVSHQACTCKSFSTGGVEALFPQPPTKRWKVSENLHRQVAARGLSLHLGPCFRLSHFHRSRLCVRPAKSETVVVVDVSQSTLF